MNRNEFQKAAKLFRAGRLTLDAFTAQVLANDRPISNSEMPTENSDLPSIDKAIVEKIFRREPSAHKGDFGRCLLIGGSANMPGSIAMAGLAALRSGAGLVKVATPPEARSMVTHINPGLMTIGLNRESSAPLDSDTLIDNETIEWADVIGMGPGLGTGDFVRQLVYNLLQTRKALVLDADALNAIAPIDENVFSNNDRVILTPHPGEFRRLFPDAPDERKAMSEFAHRVAREWGVTIVLKGHQTLVTNGREMSRNSTGNPGMATGGSGDVLTGIVTALIGQQVPLYEAAQIGTLVHGIAGDLAEKKLGQLSMIATDLLEYLPAAFRQFKSQILS